MGGGAPGASGAAGCDGEAGGSHTVLRSFPANSAGCDSQANSAYCLSDQTKKDGFAGHCFEINPYVKLPQFKRDTSPSRSPSALGGGEAKLHQRSLAQAATAGS